MKDGKMDRRVKYTKTMLKDALVQLMQKQHISGISVKSLCDIADINRSTFYTHYTDQYDLLRHIEEEVMDNLKLHLEKKDYKDNLPVSAQVMTLILEYAKENADLLRAVNGLCMGIGGTQKTCGVLTGGIAILGLYAGKGKDTEYPGPEFSKMMDEYLDWFESEFGSTECRDIIGVGCITDYETNQSYMIKCGDTLMKSYEKVLEILGNHNFEFGSREA